MVWKLFPDLKLWDFLQPERSLFKLTVEFTKDASAVKAALVGKPVCFGDTRGTVAQITSTDIVVKTDSGELRNVAITQTRCAQLVSGSMPTPKRSSPSSNK